MMNYAPDVFVAIGVTPGQKIHMARVARRLRQVDLAKLASVTQHDVSALERELWVYPAARARILDALGLEATLE